MGGNYEVVNVDPIGVVEIKFKGPNKLQGGLELALLDIPLCKHVKFTMFEWKKVKWSEVKKYKSSQSITFTSISRVLLLE